MWHSQLAPWVEAGNFTAKELNEIIVNHTSTIVGHYKGDMYVLSFPAIVKVIQVLNYLATVAVSMICTVAQHMQRSILMRTVNRQLGCCQRFVISSPRLAKFNLTSPSEAFEDDGTFRKTVFYNTLGDTYFETALRAAHKADRRTKLYVRLSSRRAS